MKEVSIGSLVYVPWRDQEDIALVIEIFEEGQVRQTPPEGVTNSS